MMVWDPAIEKYLPFGSLKTSALGKHALEAYENSTLNSSHLQTRLQVPINHVPAVRLLARWPVHSLELI